MALAPAREITTSAMAKISFNSDLIYSNCLYPGVFNSRLSILSLPQRCTTWKSSRSFGNASRTALFTLAAPRLPPMTMMTGLLAVKPHMFSPASRLPCASSARMGEPVRTALSAGIFFMVSGKLQHTFSATGMHSLLASPGVISDSWMIQGICKEAAARTTGTLTKPPLEKTTSGW